MEINIVSGLIVLSFPYGAHVKQFIGRTLVTVEIIRR